MKRPIVALVFVGVLAVGGLALAGGLAGSGKKAEGSAKDPSKIPTVGTDPSLPPINVGIATGFAPVNFSPSGPIDYSYIGDGWAYAGVRKDW